MLNLKPLQDVDDTDFDPFGSDYPPRASRGFHLRAPRHVHVFFGT